MTDVASLQHLSRNELVEEALRQGIERPERLTRVELSTELSRRLLAEDDRHDTRGLWGVARSMLASVVEAGLKMPDAASKIRGDASIEVPVRNQSPVATVTLAEIYAAQGHRARALSMLREVLKQEPDHAEAARILEALDEEQDPRPAEKKADGALAPEERVVGPSSLQGHAPTAEPQGAQDAPASPDAGPSTEYVPSTFVETSGEDVGTGEPPPVAMGEAVASAGKPIEPQRMPGLEPARDAPTAPPSLVLDRRGSELLLYAEVTVESVLSLGLELDTGQPVIEVVSFGPAREKPERRVERVLLDVPARAFFSLSGYAPDDAVRAALGWLGPAGFVPLSVGRSLDELGRPETGTLADRAERAMST